MKKLITTLALCMLIISAPSFAAKTCACPPQNIPVNQPGVKDVALSVWANEAAVSAYTYTFANYRKALQDASQYFTREGWRAFYDALKASKNLDVVIDQKLAVTAVATGAPLIIESGVVNNRYSWKVEMPMLISYLSSTATRKQNVEVSMVIVRTDKYEGTRGLAISNFVVNQPDIKQKPRT